MTVIDGRPPIYDEIVRVFPEAARPGVIFSWGRSIYAPGGGPLPPEILAHEAEHGRRQGSDVEGWWRRYLVDVPFRLDEEVAGHRAEYRELVRLHGRGQAGAYAKMVAYKLASPLYGSMVTQDEARRLLVAQPIWGFGKKRLP